MRNELTGLTGLRFLAAFYVFIFHVDLLTPLTFLPNPLRTVISLGALGVTIFFVLSGFILTYAHLKDFSTAQFPTSTYYIRFLIKRVARIYPAYLVGLIFCLLISYGLNDLPRVAIVILDATMLESYFPSIGMKWYGGGAWSVSTEFFFYLLFPLLLPLVLRLRRAALLSLFILAIILSSASGVVGLLYPHAFPWPAPYIFPLVRLPEFISGIVLGILVLRAEIRFSEYTMLGVLAITVLYLMKFGGRWFGYTMHHAAVLPAILITISVLSNIDSTRFLNWIGGPMMRYLGKISFSFYIMQLPLLTLLHGLIALGIISKSDFTVAPIFLVANLLLAALLYTLVEKPAHKLLVGFLRKPIRPLTEVVE